MEKLVGVAIFLALCELGWLAAMWAEVRKKRRECARKDARLALAEALVTRLCGAADSLLHMGRFETGSCCCGDDMERHSDPMSCGHTPVDHGEYVARGVYESAVEPARALLAKALPTWLHQKRGTRYHVLDEAVRLNASGKVFDGDNMWLYVDTQTGKLSVRRDSEFTDGRFILLGEDGTWGEEAVPGTGL